MFRRGDKVGYSVGDMTSYRLATVHEVRICDDMGVSYTLVDDADGHFVDAGAHNLVVAGEVDDAWEPFGDYAGYPEL